MDKSKEYVRMCRKAKEIQESWVAEVGDFWTYGDGGSSVSIMCYDECFGVQKEEGQIWLLRQDQLQELVGLKEGEIIWSTYCDRLYHWLVKEERPHYAKTEEQLWFCFVMKTRFDKVWDGNDWVREE